MYIYIYVCYFSDIGLESDNKLLLCLLRNEDIDGHDCGWGRSLHLF